MSHSRHSPRHHHLEIGRINSLGYNMRTFSASFLCRRQNFISIVASAVFVLFGPIAASFAQADDWPKQGLRVVVPFPVGGSNDFAARVVAESIRPRLGQTVTIDNKPGGNGALGVDSVFASGKDNHTFLVASDSVALLPLFRSNLKWDLAKNFVPVAILASQPIILVAAPSANIQASKSFRHWLNPSRANYPMQPLGKARFST